MIDCRCVFMLLYCSICILQLAHKPGSGRNLLSWCNSDTQKPTKTLANQGSLQTVGQQLSLLVGKAPTSCQLRYEQVVPCGCGMSRCGPVSVVAASHVSSSRTYTSENYRTLTGQLLTSTHVQFGHHQALDTCQCFKSLTAGIPEQCRNVSCVY